MGIQTLRLDGLGLVRRAHYFSSLISQIADGERRAEADDPQNVGAGIPSPVLIHQAHLRSGYQPDNRVAAAENRAGTSGEKRGVSTSEETACEGLFTPALISCVVLAALTSAHCRKTTGVVFQRVLLFQRALVKVKAARLGVKRS